jgi:hypothetical protein
MLLGRHEEAANLLPVGNPHTRDEWVRLHIRASIEMKKGELAQAEKHLAPGLACPWADIRSRFVASRALLLIRKKRLKEADEIIRSEQSPESKVIRIDIYRRMKRIGEAKAVLREIRDCQVAKIAEISRDLEANLMGHRRTVSDDEFFERELVLLLAA